MKYKNTLKHLFAGLTVLGVFTLASTARASSIIYSLTEASWFMVCGIVPFGSITLTTDPIQVNTVDVSVTLFNGNEFVQNQDAVSFNTDVTPISITPITTGYTADPTPSNPPFGPFGYGLLCTGCGPGSSNPLGGTLAFDVTGPAGFSISDFDASTRSVFFASDIILTIGDTEVVGALQVPEPRQTFLLLALMLVGFVAMRRSKLESTR